MPRKRSPIATLMPVLAFILAIAAFVVVKFVFNLDVGWALIAAAAALFATLTITMKIVTKGAEKTFDDLDAQLDALRNSESRPSPSDEPAHDLTLDGPADFRSIIYHGGDWPSTGPLGPDAADFLFARALPELQPVDRATFLDVFMGLPRERESYVIAGPDVVWVSERDPGILVVRYGGDGSKSAALFAAPIDGREHYGRVREQLIDVPARAETDPVGHGYRPYSPSERLTQDNAFDDMDGLDDDAKPLFDDPAWRPAAETRLARWAGTALPFHA